MNPANNAPAVAAAVPLTLQKVMDLLFVSTWSWWIAGLGIAITLIAFIWYTGYRPGISSGYADICKRIDTKTAKRFSAIQPWKLWFLIGLPLGAFLANAGWWSWSWSLGRLDAVVYGNTFVKILILMIGGFCLGFGARWAGGCMTGQCLTGISLGSRTSLAVTVAFLAAGCLLAAILFKVL